jgi:hypothetical protein
MAKVRVENPPERKPMKSSFIPQNLNQPSCIAFQPNVQNNFDLSPMLNIVPHYRGTPMEDPYLHIRDFFDLCKTQNVHGLKTEGFRLILFPFSLKDNARCCANFNTRKHTNRLQYSVCASARSYPQGIALQKLISI